MSSTPRSIRSHPYQNDMSRDHSGCTARNFRNARTRSNVRSIRNIRTEIHPQSVFYRTLGTSNTRNRFPIPSIHHTWVRSLPLPGFRLAQPRAQIERYQ